MKIVIGIVIITFVITGAILTILALWGIQPISWTIVFKSGATVAIAGATAVLVSLLYLFFLKNERVTRQRKEKL